MATSMRFGRKIALPSTRQIIHELRVMALQDELRRIEAAKPVLAPESQYALSAASRQLV